MGELPPEINLYVSTGNAACHWGKFAFPAPVHENELFIEILIAKGLDVNNEKSRLYAI
jgi:hypothetical protein